MLRVTYYFEPRRISLVVARLGSIALTVFALVSCGGGHASEDRLAIAVGLKEWAVEPAVEQVSNGRLMLDITNKGTILHRLVVVKSDFPPHQLPTVDGAVELTKLNVMLQAEPAAAAATSTVPLDLSPGKYVFLCSVVERGADGRVVSHYEQGMYAWFFVGQ